MGIQIKLALIILFGIVGGKISRRFNLPNVTGYIVAGLFLGPSFFNVLNEANQPMVDFVNEFALGIIAFSIGSEFRLEDLKKLGKDVFVITVMEVVGVLLVVFSVMYFVLNKSFVFLIIIASMSAATAPAGTMMVIRQFRAYGPLTKTILPVAALDDVLGIISFGVSLSLAKFAIGEKSLSVPMMILSPLIEITLSFFWAFQLALSLLI